MQKQPTSTTLPLTLIAIGVVFGDIGTSPLYALRECLIHSGYQVSHPDSALVYGPISLIFWSLTMIVSIKYLLFLSRATAQGEGGTFALLSLLTHEATERKKSLSPKLIAILLFGAALLYGDGMITPAISVLSAVEGLTQIHEGIPQPVIVIISASILVVLFCVQHLGTAKIGKAFGPIMTLWFLLLACMGLYRFIAHPQVIVALSPHWGLSYLLGHGWQGITIMGTVLLAVTGCEALYADIGHFSVTPLRRAWFFLAYPALILNYLGQGAVVLSDPRAAEHPFFHLASTSFIIPVVIVATAATIIASQAMITGVFSLTQQAVQLGYLPRLKIIHTNPDVRGQMYLPQVNFLLMIACVTLVLGFRSSSNLAAAYGLSVSMEMFLASSLLGFVMYRAWGWPWWKVIALVGFFLLFEGAYLVGSLMKLLHGGWFPLLVAICVWIIMQTWAEGRALLYQITSKGRLPVKHLIKELSDGRIIRVPGTAVFLSATPDGLPTALLHHLKHNKSLHKRVVLLTVVFAHQARMPKSQRSEVTTYCDDFYRVILRYGFADTPVVLRDLCTALRHHVEIKPTGISFYQGREILIAGKTGKMKRWRKILYIALSRLSRPATGYFDLPPRQVIELGTQIEM